MPPTRTTLQSRPLNASNMVYAKGVTTRSKRGSENVIAAVKRKAVSPPKQKAVKRSALGDVTNAAGKSVLETKKLFKSLTSNTITKPIAKPTAKVEKKETKVVLRSNANAPTRIAVAAPPKTTKAVDAAKKSDGRRSGRVTRRSLVSNPDENSLYVSALDESGDASMTAEITKKVSETVLSGPEDGVAAKRGVVRPCRRVMPEGVEDFDAQHWEDPNQIGNYAFDIFEYLKERESQFAIKDYMEDQIHLNKWMRSLLVDWMVEVQENFELNHETLYLAVKLVDMYLTSAVVKKETLQLVGAASIFIASKFDERIPPLVDDLIYICDGAYTPQQLLKMEVQILKAVDYELGIPLSYRFQRRYARCAQIAMPQLTLARYILELSLMEYNFVSLSDSKLGAAALLLALKMQNISSWTPTLEFYSGYKLSDIKDIVLQLNEMLHKKPKNALMTVRTKYSHKVFFEVATLPLLSNEDLFKTDV